MGDLRRCGSGGGARSISACGFLRGFAGCGICGVRVVPVIDEGGREAGFIGALGAYAESSAAAGGTSLFAAREAALAWIAAACEGAPLEPVLSARQHCGARFDLLLPLPPKPEAAATVVPRAAGLPPLSTPSCHKRAARPLCCDPSLSRIIN